MKLSDLKFIIDAIIEGNPEAKDHIVKIPNNGFGMGYTSSTLVAFAGTGIDWDSQTFFIIPENKMIEQPQPEGKGKEGDHE